VTRAALAVVLALAGCSRGVLRLDPECAPLVEVVERPSLVFTDETTTTLGTRLYVADLAAWERRYPAGSVERAALLLHEQEHARRQLATGLGRWLGRYLNDRAFMWAEEQRGHALQLRHLARHGRPVNATAVAGTLHDYRNLEGRMVGFAEALAFVQAVLSGTWTPPPEVPRG
jgi:hypothetical protein